MRDNTAANCGLDAKVPHAIDLLHEVYRLGLDLFGHEHRGVRAIKQRIETFNE